MSDYAHGEWVEATGTSPRGDSPLVVISNGYGPVEHLGPKQCAKIAREQRADFIRSARYGFEYMRVWEFVFSCLSVGATLSLGIWTRSWFVEVPMMMFGGLFIYNAVKCCRRDG